MYPIHTRKVMVLCLWCVVRPTKVILITHSLRVHKAKEQDVAEVVGVLPHGLIWGVELHTIGAEKTRFNPLNRK